MAVLIWHLLLDDFDSTSLPGHQVAADWGGGAEWPIVNVVAGRLLLWHLLMDDVDKTSMLEHKQPQRKKINHR
ncbi:hypothetical protein GOP47_0027691 [Adiantum capillus-veneris]|nr:hypothetical protein GOP47_0027691 [Adiantum capillus-veneris]